MNFSLSTSYFAGRHIPPEAMAEATRELGFKAVELGYFTRETEVTAWQRACEACHLSITSVHAFCPLPIGLPQLGPELYSLAAHDSAERAAAINAMLRTLDCAAQLQARAVVTHGGRVDLRQPGILFGSKPYRSQLSTSFRAHQGMVDWELVDLERSYRSTSVGRCIDAISFSLDTLLPRFEDANVVLAFENLPGIEAFPDPAETAFLRQRFPTPALGAWYDIGHGERKERVGDWPVQETLQQTFAITVGAHIHDVRGYEEDHCAPGEGQVDYAVLAPLLLKPDLIRVFEPSPNVTPQALVEGREMLSELLKALA